MKNRAVFSTILFFMRSQTLKKFILCALLAACPFLVLADEWQTLRGCTFVPNEWNDGDSFHVRHQGQEYIFRLYFADTPESEDSLPERVAEQAEHFGITPTQSVQAGIAAKKETARFLDAPFTVITRFQAAPGPSKMTRFYAFVIPAPARKDLASLRIISAIRGSPFWYPLFKRRWIRLSRGVFGVGMCSVLVGALFDLSTFSIQPRPDASPPLS